LRKSLALLEQQGVLERIQGSGTYVKSVQGTQQIYELFRLELTDGPGLPTAQILDVAKAQPEPGMPDWDGAACWRARRWRFLSQVPVALEEIWFPAKTLKTLSAAELGDSMYLFYQQRLSVFISRVEDQISAAPAPAWAPAASPLQTGDWAGYIERQSWTANNEFSKTWFDPKVCRYSSRLSQ
jgi:GntR family transcriptional regulator